jgi:hypothetical protein
MLCRIAFSKSGTALGTTGNGLDEAKEAGVLIEKAKMSARQGRRGIDGECLPSRGDMALRDGPQR